MSKVTVSNYTDAMVEELRELSPIDNDIATAFAEKYGLSVHSVRAKALRTDGVEYHKKAKTRKDGTAVESKAEIVADIAYICGQDSDSFESLGNATRIVLIAVRDQLRN